jgi:biopolymer transport protein ExbD
MPYPTALNPNLTPLLDVVLQLITFFMMLIHFGARLEGATRMVTLPLAPAARPGTDLTFDRLPVAVDAGGRLLVEGRPLEPGSAPAWWAEQARKRRSGAGTVRNDEPSSSEALPTVVILRADRAVSFRAVWQTLADAQEHGFAHFSLVVLRSNTR